jgi:hypothetical protein
MTAEIQTKVVTIKWEKHENCGFPYIRSIELINGLLAFVIKHLREVMWSWSWLWLAHVKNGSITIVERKYSQETQTTLGERSAI